jgi:hypothetical protein
LPIYAGCAGTITQPQDDTNDTSAEAQSRGQAFHLTCDGSSTGIRYLEITFSSAIIGRHVAAGDLIAYADLLGNGQTPADTWKNSSSFDIAVYEGDDANTVDYFAALNTGAMAAWAARGVSSVTQTIKLLLERSENRRPAWVGRQGVARDGLPPRGLIRCPRDIDVEGRRQGPSDPAGTTRQLKG